MNDSGKSRGTGFWISTSLAIFFFLCSFVLFFSLIGLFIIKESFLPQAEGKKASKFTEVVIEGTGISKIVIIPIKGIITSQSAKKFLYDTPSMVDSVKNQLKQAGEDDDVKAVILEIDSPGGGITASDIIYKHILNFKEKTKKKVIVSMQDIAASGGYYISVIADKIISHPTTITGSIGVIMPLINVANLVEKYGIEDASIASGDMKNIGSPFKKMSDKERKVLHDIVDELYMRFVTLIAEGRNMEIEDVKKLSDGRIYTGKQAIENGLVDQLGYIEDAILVAKEMAGLREATIVRYKRSFTLSEIFTGAMNNLFSERSIKINIIEEGPPGLMYLWAGYQKNYFFKWPAFN